ncbi:hypothetical protein DRA43_19200 [Micromonospora provocatoris]|nr:tetratricopeptide repeat protein [Micromonospora provocatoris]RBJ01272.1 hypothetical protein DRA43_19200 [Micromonospora provocatoris]
MKSSRAGWTKGAPILDVSGDAYLADQQYFESISYHQHVGSNPYELMPMAAPVRRDPARWRMLPPSEMLAARHRLVEFTGREEIIRDLVVWRDAPADSAICLVHASGGQGKTRLAYRLAELSLDAGWDVQLARHGTVRRRGAERAEPLPHPVGRLLIVDYADRWPRLDLERLLCADRPDDGTEPLRYLLLGRTAGAWWESLLHPLREAEHQVSDAELPALVGSVAQRQQLYDAALRAFGPVFELSEENLPPSPTPLDDQAFRLVLAIQMAALVAADAASRGVHPPSDPGRLSEYLLNREKNYWARMKEAGRVSVDPLTMGRLVAVATLTRPLAHRTAVTVLTGVGLADSAATAVPLIDDHTTCYPPESPGTVLEPLYPDRLGEDFLARSLPAIVNRTDTDPGAGPVGDLANRGGRTRGDVWHGELPKLLLTSTVSDGRPVVPSDVGRSAWTILVETAQRWPHVATGYLYPLLRARPQLVRQIGAAALATLAGYAPVDLLEVLTEHLPAGRYVSLDLAIAALARRVTAHRLAQTADPAERARLHLDLSGRLGYAGLYNEALDAARAAVTAFEEADRLNPASHLPGLASALTNLGFRLSDLGESEAALAASGRAAAIVETLTAVNPAYSHHHAVALNNLSVDLANEHRWEEALEAAQRAVIINRALCDSPSARRPRPELAMSLDNLANALRNMGRLREALPAHREAVQICDQLAADEPETHDYDLALYLNNLGLTLLDLGGLSEALQFTKRATEIRRRLARHNLGPHWEGLLRSIRAQVKITASLGRRDEALALLDEYSDLLRSPVTGVADDSEEPENELRQVRELQLRGLTESQLGEGENTVRTYQTLSLMVDTLADREPVTYRPLLGTALTELSLALSSVDRHEDALKASEAAVRLYRELDVEEPGLYRAELAVALDYLSTDLDRLGQRAEAGPIQNEAIAILRALPPGRRGAQLDALAQALHNGAIHLLGQGAVDQAVPLLTEAVAIREELASESIGQPLSLLVKSQGSLAFMLSRLGSTEAAAVARRAVEAYRRLGSDFTAHPDHQLAIALQWCATALGGAGDREAALDTIEELIALAARFASLNYRFAIKLPLAYLEAAMLLASLGREPEAIKADHQAVLSSATLATSAMSPVSPGEQRGLRADEQRLADLLNERGYRAREAGRTEAALDLLTRSVLLAQRVEDVLGERLARENVYLALWEAQRYPEALAALLELAEFFAREAQHAPSDQTDAVPESPDASMTDAHGDLAMRADRYRREVIEAHRALIELGEPFVVRDWMADADVNQWVEKYGLTEVRNRKILLVERRHDVTAVLGHAGPERRLEFVQAFLAILDQRPDH